MKHKDFWIEKRKGNNQTLWVNLNSWKLFADQFYRSSEILFTQIKSDYDKIAGDHQNQQKTENLHDKPYTPMIDHVYFLLIGYTLENMIKGILAYENPTLVSGGKLANSIKSHNLGVLAVKVKVLFSDEEKQLLDFITPNIEWFSKYPLPTKASGSISSGGYRINVVRKIFLIIYRKLSDKMQSIGALKSHLNNYKYPGNRHL